ncbi:tryptophan halogenase family protein [Sphingomonas sp. LY29]|uniref:tryptophan halogenase family protein n=1 Tax=Sphingomonas sp. LY29 TaxID=3095341 RepID=UPI002D7A0EE9|nr:tryptophan halogenase family protein [Sphingomonas sp. LY29]WRP26809.1 tryptophan halogenase family protein [Sphingomonas sp. LY29]
MSKQEPHTDILIVGGGTAGWMAAAILSQFIPAGYRVRLIESEEIGTVGVGEATIPQIRLFNQALGIDEDEFLRATQGTYKLGIEFVDWSGPGSRYMHAFGEVGRGVGIVPFQHYWHRAQALGLAGPLDRYSLNEVAARALKMQRADPRTSTQLPAMPYAFHFDAGLYARFLRARAEAQGVERIEGKVVDVSLDGETGRVSAVTLEGDRKVAADLFVDSSGFRGLLIEQALQTGYEDWSQWLPCNRAMAVPCDSGGGFTPYTRSTARKAGWQWRIPLQHRIGNGYVYCSEFISDDEAAETLLANLDGAPQADPRPLRFVTGKRRKAWNRNVVALGLSSGFMEPLESTSIHMIQSGLSRLIKMLPRGSFDPSVPEEYNRQTDFEYRTIRDFLVLHYKATVPETSAFWRHCANMEIPEALAHRIALFRANGTIAREHDELFTEVGWLQVLVGQGIVPTAHHPLADTIGERELGDYMSIWEKLIEREVAQMPSHADFIARHSAAAGIAA